MLGGALSWSALALFYFILLLPIAVLWQMGLQSLIRSLLMSVARMSLQLLLVGVYLQVVFKLDHPALNLLWLLVMIGMAALTVGQRAKLPLRKMYLPLSFGLLGGAVPVLAMFLLVLVQPTPWYHAQYLIPITGMLLGNALSGLVVAMQRLAGAHEGEREDIRALLVMGASPYEASLPLLRRALMASYGPQLAGMATLGLVSLPGMMTGQILGGADPLTAVQFQIAIMLGISACQSLATLAALLTASHRLVGPSGLFRPVG
ncbi:ABC transporter permease [Polycladidibacter hongkongensis]|uniref:ABC transporter permease n=1 Tax=Polycladidibacter hongkongensis TaxID=1647556 RepID=UPI000833BB50|nr:ABC transporter permease [Pseudovibrio hongkongensis]